MAVRVYGRFRKRRTSFTRALAVARRGAALAERRCFAVHGDLTSCRRCGGNFGAAATGAVSVALGQGFAGGSLPAGDGKRFWRARRFCIGWHGKYRESANRRGWGQRSKPMEI